MAELQDALNQIMSNPEAMRQVQSLGEQLGLGKTAAPPLPSPPPDSGNTQMLSALTKLAPLMRAAKPQDETAALLNALQPFLSGEKRARLAQAQRLISLIRMIPLLKDSGLFL